MKAATKEFLEFGAIALGIGAVVLFIAKGTGQGQATNAADTSVNAPPNYLDYNQNNPNAQAGTSLASVGALQNGNPSSGIASCSCGGSSTTLFSGAQAFSDALDSQLSGFLNIYQENIMSQFPDYVSQFFNNQSGADMSANSVNQFNAVGSA